MTRMARPCFTSKFINDAELARSIGQDAMAMRSCPILALAQVQYLDIYNIKVLVTCVASFTSIVESTYSHHVDRHTGLKTDQAFAHLEH